MRSGLICRASGGPPPLRRVAPRLRTSTAKNAHDVAGALTDYPNGVLGRLDRATRAESDLLSTTGDRFMIVRSQTVMLAQLGAGLAAPGASAADITRGGQPAELTVTGGGAHSVRVTIKPVGLALSPNPSLFALEIKNPAISLRTIEHPMQA